jgi:hypothetical protein
MSAILDTHHAVVGSSGAGKTVTAKGEAEQLLRERRHLAIIDPTDAWYGMRSNVAGDGPGFDIPIFGGRHGDVAIGPHDGDAIARIVIEQQVSAIVSLAHIHEAQLQRVFMAAFVKRLRAKPRGNFHLIADEADELCPQTARDDVGFALTEDMIWIAKRGRLAGFVLTVITQRPADISKAVLSQMQTIVAHQLVDPRDQKAIDDYLRAKGDRAIRAEVMASLPSLAQGERWIYSPKLGILERGVSPPLTTFDSSRTPAPGEVHVEPKMLSSINVGAIAKALEQPRAETAAAAYHAGAEAGQLLMERDRRIAELENEIAALKQSASADKRRADHHARALAALRDDANRSLAAFPADADLHRSSAEQPAASATKRSPAPRAQAPEQEAAPARPSAAAAPSERLPKPPAGPDLPPRRQRILDALAWVSVFLGKESVPRAVVAYIAETTPNSSTFEKDLGAMRTMALIDYPEQGHVRFTAVGKPLARAWNAPATRDELFSAVSAKMPPRRSRILQQVWAGAPLSREELATACETTPTSSTFEKDLGAMRTLGLIDYPSKGEVQLAAVLRGS